jgi:hypothetical protein
MSASTPEGKCPGWAAKRYAPVSTELIADLQLWRAATQVDAGDLRPTGPTPARPRRSRLAAATRRATRRRGYP